MGLSTLFDFTKPADKTKEVSVVLFNDLCTFGKWDNRLSLTKVETLRDISAKESLKAIQSLTENQIKILIGTSPFLLVQGDDFHIDRLDHYFDHLSFLYKKNEVSFEYKKLSGQDIYLVYGIPDSLKTLLNTDKYRGEHLVAILSNELMAIEKRSGLAIHIDDGHLTVVIQKDKKTQFANTYSCAKGEDFLYYILMLLKEYELNPETTPITTFGRVGQKSPIFSLLRQYLGNLEFATRGTDFLIENDQFAHLCQDLFLCRKCV